MRRCKVRTNEKEVDAKLHAWCADGTAIVEFDDGVCCNTSALNIRFDRSNDTMTPVQKILHDSILGPNAADTRQDIIDMIAGISNGEIDDNDAIMLHTIMRVAEMYHRRVLHVCDECAKKVEAEKQEHASTGQIHASVMIKNDGCNDCFIALTFDTAKEWSYYCKMNSDIILWAVAFDARGNIIEQLNGVI